MAENLFVLDNPVLKKQITVVIIALIIALLKYF